MGDNNAEKIVSLIDYTKDNAEAGSGTKAARAEAETSRDMGKAALILTLILVVMLSVFYFKLSDKIDRAGKDMDALRGGVAGLSQNVAALDGRVNQVENIPAKSKQMVLNALIQEMSQKAAFLSAETADPAQKEKLDKALELLKQATAAPAE
jgi:uncharacterized protein YoxC